MVSWLVIIFLSGVSGFLLVISFPDFGKYIFAFIALVPVLVIWGRAGFWKAFLSGYIMAAVFFGVIFYWAADLGIHVWIALTLFQGVYFALWAGLVSWCCRGQGISKDFKTMIFLLVSWVFIECIRNSGPLGLGWGGLGYSQAPDLPLIQSASVLGYYWVGIIVLGVNVVIAAYIDRLRRDMASSFAADWKELELKGTGNIILRGFIGPFTSKVSGCSLPLFTVLVISALIFSLAYGFGRLKQAPEGPGFRAAVLQMNVGMYRPWGMVYLEEARKNLLHLMELAMKTSPDIVILPETTLPASMEKGDPIEMEFRGLAVKNAVYVLFGIPRRIGDVFKNAAVLMSPQGEIKGEYHKIHLVPFGEYLPFEKQLRKYPVFDRVQDFVPGNEEVLFDFPGGKFGVLICFESNFASVARAKARMGANFLVVVTNDSWFGLSSAAANHIGWDVFRAVETGLPLIQSGNSGISAIIDSRGRIQQETTLARLDMISGTIYPSDKRTIYTGTGDIVMPASVMAFLILCGIRFLKEKKSG